MPLHIPICKIHDVLVVLNLRLVALHIDFARKTAATLFEAHTPRKSQKTLSCLLSNRNLKPPEIVVGGVKRNGQNAVRILKFRVVLVLQPRLALSHHVNAVSRQQEASHANHPCDSTYPHHLTSCV